MNRTVEISDDELLQVTEACQVLQRFLDKIVSPNELYLDEFIRGLSEAAFQVENKEFEEVNNFADFVK